MCKTKKRIRLIVTAAIPAGHCAGAFVPGSEGGHTANYPGKSAACPPPGYDSGAKGLFGTLFRALLTYSGTTYGKGA